MEKPNRKLKSPEKFLRSRCKNLINDLASSARLDVKAGVTYTVELKATVTFEPNRYASVEELNFSLTPNAHSYVFSYLKGGDEDDEDDNNALSTDSNHT